MWPRGEQGERERPREAKRKDREWRAKRGEGRQWREGIKEGRGREREREGKKRKGKQEDGKKVYKKSVRGEEGKMTRRAYMSEIEGGNVRG